MEVYNSKLIIIRGNSGAGKSSIAKEVRSRAKGKIAIIEQDYLRRHLLKEKEAEGQDNQELIYIAATFALEKGYHVILEGILRWSRYGQMIQKLVKRCPDNHIFYIDVSFAESLKRHASKPNARDFGAKEMKEWYKPQDYAHMPNEIIIPQSSKFDETVKMILAKTTL